MNQESQKRLLTHLVTIEKMTEDLSSAAQCGDFNACTALLRQGAGLNDTDSSGILPHVIDWCTRCPDIKYLKRVIAIYQHYKQVTI